MEPRKFDRADDRVDSERRRRQVGRRRRLALEAMEPRVLLATIEVKNLLDSGPDSFRAAVDRANLDAAPDTIVFDLSGTIPLASDLSPVTQPVVIDGNGKDVTVGRAAGSSATHGLQLAAGSDHSEVKDAAGHTITFAGFDDGVTVVGATGVLLSSGLAVTGSAAAGVVLGAGTTGAVLTGVSVTGNPGTGVLITGGAHDNVLGDALPPLGPQSAPDPLGDDINGNGGRGVDLTGAGAGNLILSNRIYGNGGGVAVSPTDSAPVLTAALDFTGDYRVDGSVPGSAAGGRYLIQVFDNGPGSPGPEGKTLLASVAAYTDASGRLTADPGGAPGHNVYIAKPAGLASLAGDALAATATPVAAGSLSATGSTTAYGSVLATAGLVVRNTGDSSASNSGSLRAALANADDHPNGSNPGGAADVVTFAVAPASATYGIDVAAALPDVTDRVVVDGTTARDGANNPARVVVRSDPANATPVATGFRILAGGAGSQLLGLSVTGFGVAGVDVNGAAGVTLSGLSVASPAGATGVLVENGSAGVRVLGATVSGGAYGVRVTGGSDDAAVGSAALGGTYTPTAVAGASTAGVDVDGSARAALTGVSVASPVGAAGILVENGSAGAGVLGATVSGGAYGIEVTGGSDDARVDAGAVNGAVTPTTVRGASTAGVEVLNSAGARFLGVGVTGGATGVVFDGATNATFAAGSVLNPTGGDGVFLRGGSGNVVDTSRLTGGLPGAASGLGVGVRVVDSNDDTVSGDTVGRFAAGGVAILGTSAGNKVIGSFVGTDAAAAANDLGNGGPGVLVGATGGGNLIGDPAASGSGNTIAFNAEAGVSFSGDAGPGNAVAGNTVTRNLGGGVAVAGGKARVDVTNNVVTGNGKAGIRFDNSAPADGDSAPRRVVGNTVSGNAADGIVLSGPATSNFAVSGNTATGNTGGNGLWLADSTGDTVSGNTLSDNGASAPAGSGYGLLVTNTAAGGVAQNHAITGNTVTLNARGGLAIVGGSNANRLAGNFVGTDAAGDAGLGNRAGSGVLVADSAGTVIGDGTPAGRNVVSGNTGYGIDLTGPGASGTVTQGNLIGYAPDGVTHLTNTGSGVLIGAGVSGTVVGAPAPSTDSLTAPDPLGNRIAYTTAAGVEYANPGTKNVVLSNPIAFVPAGNLAPLNAILNGPAAPSLTVYNYENDIELIGNVGPLAPGRYLVQVFENGPDDSAPDARKLAGTVDLTTKPDGSFDVDVYKIVGDFGNLRGRYVTTTFTPIAANAPRPVDASASATGNTSSVSAPVQAVDALVVLNTNDAGVSSLRFAVENANRHPIERPAHNPLAVPPDRITFAFDPAVRMPIDLTSPLPAVTDTVIIDGADAVNFDNSPANVEIHNALAVDVGLHVVGEMAANSEVSGLKFTGFVSAGVLVDGATGVKLLGLTTTGGAYGIRVIAGSDRVLIDGTPVHGTFAPTAVTGATTAGVDVDGSDGVQINGVTVASPTGATGILLENKATNAQVNGATVTGGAYGVRVTGGSNGVFVDPATVNGAFTPTTVAGATTAGVDVDGSVHAVLSGLTVTAPAGATGVLIENKSTFARVVGDTISGGAYGVRVLGGSDHTGFDNAFVNGAITSTTVSGATAAGVDVGGSADVGMSEVTVTLPAATSASAPVGILIEGGSLRALVLGAIISGGAFGVQITGGSDDAQIDTSVLADTTVRGAATAGVDVNGSAGALVKGVSVTSPIGATGVLVENKAVNAAVTSGTVTGGVYGVRVTGGSDDASVTGVAVDSAATAGVDVNGSVGATLTRLTVTAPAGATGVLVENMATGANVLGATVRGGVYGIQVTGGSDGAVVDAATVAGAYTPTTVAGATTAGVDLNGSANATVNGVTVTAPAGATGILAENATTGSAVSGASVTGGAYGVRVTGGSNGAVIGSATLNGAFAPTTVAGATTAGIDVDGSGNAAVTRVVVNSPTGATGVLIERASTFVTVSGATLTGGAYGVRVAGGSGNAVVGPATLGGAVTETKVTGATTAGIDAAGSTGLGVLGASVASPSGATGILIENGSASATVAGATVSGGAFGVRFAGGSNQGALRDTVVTGPTVAGVDVSGSSAVTVVGGGVVVPVGATGVLVRDASANVGVDGTPVNGGTRGVWFTNTSGDHYAGASVTGVPGSQFGVAIDAGSHDITVASADVRKYELDGVFLTGGARDNHVLDTGVHQSGEGVRIDGASFNEVGAGEISGNNGVGVLVINGASDGNSIHDTRVGRLSAADGRQPNLGDGVLIVGAVRTTLSRNTIGYNAGGPGSPGYGVRVVKSQVAAGANNVLDGNTVVGNAGAGVLLDATNRTTLTDNLVGTDPGTGNHAQGVVLVDAAANTLGGNQVRYNDGDGVAVFGAGSSGNVLQGNTVSFNAGGVSLSSAGSGNVVGTGSGPQNVIAANRSDGLSVDSTAGTTASGNLIQSNGTAGGGYGVRVANSSNTFFGSDTILMNAWGGVAVFNSRGVGLGASQVSRNPGGDGVLLVGGSGNALAGDTISDNGLAAGEGFGVKVVASTPAAPGAVSNDLTGNSITGNPSGGVALLANTSGTRLTANTVARNGRAGFGSGVLVIDSPANTLTANTVVANTGPGVAIFGAGSAGMTLAGNFLGTDARHSPGLGNAGDGLVVVGAAGASVRGNVVAGNSANGVLLRSATAATVDGNAVSSNGNDGVVLDTGSSRNVVSANTVVANTLGVHLIDAGNNLVVDGNTIGNNRLGGVTIEGAGSTGNHAAGNTITGNGLVDGPARSSGYGVLVKNASGNVVGADSPPASSAGVAPGVAPNVIAGNFGDDVRIAGGGYNVVRNNLIGTNAAGDAFATEGRSVNGVTVHFSNNNVITQNVISGHGTTPSRFAAVLVDTDNILNTGDTAVSTANSSDGNTISLNLIGTNSRGAAGGDGLKNTDGVVIAGASNNRVDRNVISGSLEAGVHLFNAAANTRLDITGGPNPSPATATLIGSHPTTQNAVTGNQIGSAQGGIGGDQNTVGVFLNDANGNTVTGNSIVGNRAEGVVLLGAGDQNVVRSNQIAGNGVGVFLDGVPQTPNVQIPASGSNAAGDFQIRQTKAGPFVDSARLVVTPDGTFLDVVFGQYVDPVRVAQPSLYQVHTLPGAGGAGVPVGLQVVGYDEEIRTLRLRALNPPGNLADLSFRLTIGGGPGGGVLSRKAGNSPQYLLDGGYVGTPGGQYAAVHNPGSDTLTPVVLGLTPARTRPTRGVKVRSVSTEPAATPASASGRLTDAALESGVRPARGASGRLRSSNSGTRGLPG